MNKLCCFLTGGHKYDASNMTCFNIYDANKNETVGFKFVNSCIKCNKTYNIDIPSKPIFRSLGIEEEEHE